MKNAILYFFFLSHSFTAMICRYKFTTKLRHDGATIKRQCENVRFVIECFVLEILQFHPIE